jgi:hypothetical protein
LPPRIWRDVASTDTDVPGRDASCCVMARSLNNSHVLYVRTELHYMCHGVERSEGRTAATEHTDILSDGRHYRLWQMLAGIWDCGALAVLIFRQLSHYFLKLGDFPNISFSSPAFCSKCGTA